MPVVKTVSIRLFTTGTEDAKTKIDRVDKAAADLKRLLGDEFKVKIDTAAATTKLALLRSELRRVAGDSGGTGGLLSRIIGTAGAAGGAGASGLLGITATLPLIGTLGVPAMAALAGAAALALAALTPVVAALLPITLGFGTLALVAGPGLANVFTALTSKGTALKTALAKLTPEQRALVKQAEPLKDSFEKLQKAIQPQVTKAFSEGLKIIKELMPALKPLVEAAAKAIAKFLDNMADWLASPQGKSFINWLKTVGPADIRNFGRVMWDIAHVVGDALHFLYSTGSWIDKLVTHWKEDWIIIKSAALIALDYVALGALHTVNFILGAFAALPGPLGAPFRAARNDIAQTMAGITANVHKNALLIGDAWAAIHGRKIPMQFDLTLPKGVGLTTGGQKTGRAAGWLVPGYGGGDRWPALLEGGEAVVPKHLTPAVAPFLKAHGVPGFAVGGMIGPDFSMSFVPGAGVFANSLTSAANRIENAIVSFVGTHALLTGAIVGGFGVGGPSGGSAAVNMAIARALFPWSSSQWPSFNAVEMREAGYSLTARNPRSGAYGMAQFIGGPSEYYQWGGNPFTAAGQLTGMFNYIRGVYGTPANAWAHEVAWGWYDRGGYLPTGLSLALNTTGRPERVGGGGCTYNIYVGVVGNDRDAGRRIVEAIRSYERGSGTGWRS